MSFNLKTGGTWQTLASGWVKVAGTWQEVQSAWVKVAGTWQRVYNAAVVNVIGASLSDSSVTPTDAEVGYQLTPTGFEQTYEGVGGSYATINTWLLEGSASDYDCRLTVNAGTAPAGSATGTWLNLGSARAWTLTDTAPIGGPITNSCTIAIRDATTLDVLDSATVTMSVEETA